MLDGCILGVHQDPGRFVTAIRHLRRAGEPLLVSLVLLLILIVSMRLSCLWLHLHDKRHRAQMC